MLLCEQFLIEQASPTKYMTASRVELDEMVKKEMLL